MFADMQPRHGSGNRLKIAADFPGSIGLQIPGIQVAGTAIIEEQDARLDLGRRS
jgi:hypothetical protein